MRRLNVRFRDTFIFSLAPTTLVFHIIIFSGKEKAKNLSWQLAKKTNKVEPAKRSNLSKPGELLNAVVSPRPQLVLVKKSRRAIRAASVLIFLFGVGDFAPKNRSQARSNTSEKPLVQRNPMLRWSNEFLGNFLQRLLEKKSHFSDLFYSFTMFS